MAKGYIIARVRIDDLETYKKYMERSPGVTAEFGGKFLARGGQTHTAEGEEETRRIVLMEFPSFEAAKACYYSDAYQEIKAIRAPAGEAQFLLVEGVD
ncbi:MAG: DUF1330 domain-containing protein [Pikeienuella sp.]